MKLWILERDTRKGPIYDCMDGCVVEAFDEEQARLEAADNCGDEGRETWLNGEFSSCDELTATGCRGIILRDFRAE